MIYSIKALCKLKYKSFLFKDTTIKCIWVNIDDKENNREIKEIYT